MCECEGFSDITLKTNMPCRRREPTQLDGRKRRAQIFLLIFNLVSLSPNKFTRQVSAFLPLGKLNQFVQNVLLDFRASNQIASNKQTKNNKIFIVNLNLYISKCYFCLNNNILLIILPTHYFFQLNIYCSSCHEKRAKTPIECQMEAIPELNQSR